MSENKIIDTSKMFANRKKYNGKNVYESALDRMRYIFDEFDEVVVSMSGGKDSCVALDVTIEVAREKGRLPVKVYFLDQEVEWKATIDFMKELNKNKDVKLYWFQIPFRLWNTLSLDNEYLLCWNPLEKDKWVHEQVEFSIKENPFNTDRFHSVLSQIPSYIKDKDSNSIAVVSGVRADESITRRNRVLGANNSGLYKDKEWTSQSKKFNRTLVYPIYDYSFDDIWIHIENKGLLYNKIYDHFYRHNVEQNKFRVSALIHETAYHSVLILQELEPEIYNRFFNRICDISTFNHLKENLYPKELPYMFRDWKEYRDYLLVYLIPKDSQEIYKKRWQGQDSIIWYKSHVREICINDIDGTINSNTKKKIVNKDRVLQYRKFNDKLSEAHKETE